MIMINTITTIITMTSCSHLLLSRSFLSISSRCSARQVSAQDNFCKEQVGKKQEVGSPFETKKHRQVFIYRLFVIFTCAEGRAWQEVDILQPLHIDLGIYFRFILWYCSIVIFALGLKISCSGIAQS